VTALEPVMREAAGAWIGWSGDAGPEPGPFEADGLHLVGIGLSETEVRDFYEGFCSATLWPLYHDVIAPPAFHRRWWEAYASVNRRFAQAAAAHAADRATVWVHDYQLQLVPKMLREQRADVRIGFFNHIPFPGPAVRTTGPLVVRPAARRQARRKFVASARRWKPSRSAPSRSSTTGRRHGSWAKIS
jgi:trehalose-6-phosphate synthase